MGRLSSAERRDHRGTAVLQSFVYDASGNRVLSSQKTSGASRSVDLTLNVFDSLVLRHAIHPAGLGDYERDVRTEQVYLNAGGAQLGHVVYSESPLPSPSATNRVHVFMPVGDQIGSTSFVIDRETSEVVESAGYLAYGGVESDYRPARSNNYRADVRYTSHWDDAQVGLVYFGARYYSPGLGRFISPDPMTVHELKADLNPYAYVHGSPLRLVDPFGLDFGEFVQGGGGNGYGSGGWGDRSSYAAYTQGYSQATAGSSAYSQAGWAAAQAWSGGGGGSGTPTGSSLPGGPHHPMPDSILERVPGGVTWRLNPIAANALQGLFDDLAIANGKVPLNVKLVGLLMIPASVLTSETKENWVNLNPNLLKLPLPQQLAEIAHEMIHVLQWYRFGSTVEQRNKNWSDRAAIDQRRGDWGNAQVAWNPDGTATTIQTLIGGDAKRLDVIDRRCTLQGVAFWAQYDYMPSHHRTFSLP